MEKITIFSDIQQSSKKDELNASPNVKDLIKKVKSGVNSSDIDVEILQKNFADTYGNLVKIITETVKDNPIKPSEVKFTLGIQSEGKIGIVSTLSSSQKSITGLEFTIKFSHD